MPAKIRLARHGRKKFAYYHIVIADGRAPRDGKFIEKIGIYNPNTNPATIELDFDKAMDWLFKGAQPTETVRAILSYKGVLYKKHLLEGVKKGAFNEEEAETRFQSWLTEKEAKIQAKRDRIAGAEEADRKKRFEAESKIREARAQELAKKTSELVEEIRKEGEGEEETAEEAAGSEDKQEAPKPEEEKKEKPGEKPEGKKEEKAEEQDEEKSGDKPEGKKEEKAEEQDEEKPGEKKDEKKEA